MPSTRANPAARRTPSKIFQASVTSELSCASDWRQFVVNDLVQDRWVDWFLQPCIGKLIVVKGLVAGRNHHDWNHGPAPARRQAEREARQARRGPVHDHQIRRDLAQKARGFSPIARDGHVITVARQHLRQGFPRQDVVLNDQDLPVALRRTIVIDATERRVHRGADASMDRGRRATHCADPSR